MLLLMYRQHLFQTRQTLLH